VQVGEDPQLAVGGDQLAAGLLIAAAIKGIDKGDAGVAASTIGKLLATESATHL
jgi:hypothetical protein